MTAAAGLPAARVAIAAQNGIINPAWYRFFTRIWERTGGFFDGVEEVTDAVTTLQGQVTALQGQVSGLLVAVSSLQAADVSLDARLDALEAVLSGSASSDLASIAIGGSATQVVPVPGALMGDFALGSCSLDIVGLGITAYVSAADTVTLVLNNNTAGAVDLASATFRARVISH